MDRRVGPVLEKTAMSFVLIEALSKLHDNVQVIDQGSYLRVLVQDRCVLRKDLVERLTAEPFHLPQDLELLMPSFKGSFQVDENQAIWQFDQEISP